MTTDAAAIVEQINSERGNRAGVSTITLNLVGFVEDEELLDWLLARTDRIAQKHPARAVLLDGCHASDAHDVHTQRKEVNETVQTEELVLGVKGIGAVELRSIVHGAIVPNVQTILLWAGEELDADPRFVELADLATSVVLDTSRVARTDEGLRQLIHYLGDGERRNVRDVAYMRLGPWQEMIAQFFDDPGLAAELPRIERVEIAAGSRAEGYYFVGWLASRLQWDLCGKNEFCNPQGGRISIKFVREGQPRRVKRIELHSARTTFRAQLQDDSPDLVCLTVEGGAKREKRCAPLHAIDILSLIEQAILLPNNDELFRDSLQKAKMLVEAAR